MQAQIKLYEALMSTENLKHVKILSMQKDAELAASNLSFPLNRADFGLLKSMGQERAVH